MPCRCSPIAASPGIAADEARCRELLDRSTAVATALSPYIGYAADRRHREDRGQDRPPDRRHRARAQADSGGRARADPVAGRDDLAGHPGRGKEGVTVLRTCALLARAARRRARAAQHARLFPPEDLGLLEGPDRDAYQRPDQIMDALQIGEGSVVADLGAGGGWFTVRLARRVGPNGRVYAEDIQPRDDRRDQAPHVKREGLAERRTPCSARPSIARLPPGSLDAVLMVDAYHEFEQPVTLLRNVAGALKPDGLIGIVNYKKDGGGPGPAMEERVDPEKVIADAQAAGLRADASAKPSCATSTCSSSASDAEMSVPPFFAEYQQPVDAEMERVVPAAAQRGRACDGLHRACAVETGSRRAGVALRRAVPRHGGARGAGGGGDRTRARRVVDSRRPAVHGRRAAAARTARRTTWRSANRWRFSPRSVCSISRTDRSPAPTSRRWPSRMTSMIADAVGTVGTDRRAGAGPRGHRPSDRFRDARADSSRQDRRAVRRRGRVRRADGRGRRRTDRGAVGVREESRAGVPDRRRPARRRRAIRPRPARRSAPTPARRRSCRSAAWTARGSSPRSCARRRIARWRRSARKRRPAARAVGVRRGEAAVVTARVRDGATEVHDVDELRQQLRSLGYLDAGVDRFVLGPAQRAARAGGVGGAR